MKKFIKNFRINRIKKKILKHEISANYYKQWVKKYSESGCSCGHNDYSDNVVPWLIDEKHHRLMVKFFKKQLKELIK